jgi:hypothetical protein
MKRRPYECLVLHSAQSASPPFSLVRFTFETHTAAQLQSSDREQKRDPMTDTGSKSALDAKTPTTEAVPKIQ